MTLAHLAAGLRNEIALPADTDRRCWCGARATSLHLIADFTSELVSPPLIERALCADHKDDTMAATTQARRAETNHRKSEARLASLRRKVDAVGGVCWIIEGGVPCDEPTQARRCCSKHYAFLRSKKWPAVPVQGAAVEPVGEAVEKPVVADPPTPSDDALTALLDALSASTSAEALESLDYALATVGAKEGESLQDACSRASAERDSLAAKNRDLAALVLRLQGEVSSLRDDVKAAVTVYAKLWPQWATEGTVGHVMSVVEREVLSLRAQVAEAEIVPEGVNLNAEMERRIRASVATMANSSGTIADIVERLVTEQRAVTDGLDAIAIEEIFADVGQPGQAGRLLILVERYRAALKDLEGVRQILDHISVAGPKGLPDASVGYVTAEALESLAEAQSRCVTLEQLRAALDYPADSTAGKDELLAKVQTWTDARSEVGTNIEYGLGAALEWDEWASPAELIAGVVALQKRIKRLEMLKAMRELGDSPTRDELILLNGRHYHAMSKACIARLGGGTRATLLSTLADGEAARMLLTTEEG